jgi:LacI family transcriptional regulator
MKDVAELAGVSKQTVSAIINGKPGITDETRDRVLSVIEQLGYRPDITARSLSTGRTRTIALLITDVSSPVAAKIASTAEDYAYAAQYTLILYNTHDDVVREKACIESAIQRSVDGVLFVSANDESKAPQTLQSAGMPLVVIDRCPRGYIGPSVMLDNVQAGRLAAEHLWSLGHRHIVQIGGPQTVSNSQERLTGFQDLLRERGNGVELWFETAENWHIEAGYEAMRRVLGHGAPFTAVFAAGDLLAIGAMSALREASLGIPMDVSVIGVDDIDLDRFLHPPLTTVSQSIARMAMVGTQKLIAILDSGEPGEIHTLVQPLLVVRQSTAALPPT